MAKPFLDLDREFGFPEGTMDSLWKQESGRGHNKGPSSAGARGHFQFMPATRQEMIDQHGIDPWTSDVEVAARAGAIYLAKQLKYFGGDIEKALAAYNAGAGRVEKAVARAGDDWLSTMPAETKNYVPSILDRIDYTRRWLAKETTQEEDEKEIELRRGILSGFNMSSDDIANMKPEDILGQVFFALISYFVGALTGKSHTSPQQADEPQAPAPVVASKKDTTPANQL